MAGQREGYDAAVGNRPVLHSARFVLRRPVSGDMAALVDIVGDWEVARRLARIPFPYTMDHARFFIDEVVPNELVWAIIDRATGAMVGVIGLVPYAQSSDMIELGYYIGRAHWGRGIATEAGTVVAAYGAGLVGQQRLRSGYFADNPASGRVLEKLGFVNLHPSTRHCMTTGEDKPSMELAFPDA